MKNVLLFSILFMPFAAVSAGVTTPLKKSGGFCIERSTFEPGDVTAAIEKDFLGPACSDSGGVVSLYRLSLAHQERGCPFGHAFTYELTGSCYRP